MDLKKVLNSWGIEVLTESNIPEFLMREYPSKCFYIDFFPKTVNKEWAYKFNQIEDEVYRLLYSRVYTIMLKLWVYDRMGFESELLEDRLISKRRFSFISIRAKKLFKKSLTDISRKEQLSFLLQLSKKNIIDVAFFLEELRIVIVPSWCCFIIFIHNEATIPFVKDIVRTEGLHLRKVAEI